MESEIKENFERSGENRLGQEGLERCDCGPMPPGGQKVKKKRMFHGWLYYFPDFSGIHIKASCAS
jgi:hypothetical protein